MTFLKVAAVVALIQGVAHAALIIFGKPKHGAEEVAIIDAMKSRRFNFAGSQRSYWDFYYGYALIAAIICVVEAVLFWQLTAFSPEVVRPIAIIFIAFNVVHAAMAARYFFITPIVMDLAITICLVGAVLRP